MAREEARRKLHEKIEAIERNERILEFHQERIYPNMELHRKSNSATVDQVDTLVMFDVDTQSWSSCKYLSIIQLRVRLHTYDTFPGTVANREEYLKILREKDRRKIRAVLGPQPRFLDPAKLDAAQRDIVFGFQATKRYRLSMSPSHVA